MCLATAGSPSPPALEPQTGDVQWRAARNANRQHLRIDLRWNLSRFLYTCCDCVQQSSNYFNQVLFQAKQVTKEKSSMQTTRSVEIRVRSWCTFLVGCFPTHFCQGCQQTVPSRLALFLLLAWLPHVTPRVIAKPHSPTLLSFWSKTLRSFCYASKVFHFPMLNHYVDSRTSAWERMWSCEPSLWAPSCLAWEHPAAYSSTLSTSSSPVRNPSL